ncbi:isochorismatase [Sorangium cellulosum]|uniref:isochorismatase n=1 Tax=Sorangium cellulosum TaxID=56 RepID=A0A2L0EV93_SORCE|nr:isochorismatase family protein [Sorangium cellulosum]AUX43228.1 isochorismatase [Sorangium cellulosum]
MGIPSIQTYSMPRADELPRSRVSWRPDPRRAVLLIHDMQQYFLGYYDAGASPIVELLANTHLLRERCAASGIPVVYTKQPAEQTKAQRGLLLDLWGPGLTQQPDKQDIVSELSPGSADTVLTKWRYSAFQRTELLDLMRRWGRDQLIVCGVYAHIGCLMTACEAFMNDIQPFFVTDATADFSRAQHEMAIAYVAERCGVALPTREVAAALAPRDGAVSLPSDVSPRAPLGAALDRAPRLDRLRDDVAELLEQPAAAISDRENVLDLGLDSIRLMTLVERWRGAGIEVTFVELAELPTLAQWWELLSTRLPREASRAPRPGAEVVVQEAAG